MGVLYRYPETENALGASKVDLLTGQIEFLEQKLEAAYWSSGDWVRMSYDRWLECLSHDNPKAKA